jgi:hypothetical protein
MPALRLREVGDQCQLSLAGWASGRGDTLQEAADDLVQNLLVLSMKLRSSGLVVSSELPPLDLRLYEFVQDLARIAAEGGDVRGRVFGVAADPALEG